MTRTEALTLLAVTLLGIAMALAGVPRILGAHPWWAAKSGIFGSLIGAAAYLILRLIGLSRRSIGTIAALGLTGAAIATVQGKAVFVASYGQDTLAGKFWFLGWFAIAGAVTALITALLARR